KRLGRGQVDDEIEFGRLLDWDVAWLGPSQNLVNIVCGTAEEVEEVWSIRHQTSRFDRRPIALHRRQPRITRPGVDASLVGEQDRIDTDVKCFRAVLELREDGSNVLSSLDLESDNFEVNHACRCLNLAHFAHRSEIGSISQNRKPAKTGKEVTQEFDFLAGKVRVLQRNRWWAPSPAAARVPRAATPPRRRAWLRIFGVRCSLPCDPPVGGHSCNGGMIPRFPPLRCGISVPSMSGLGHKQTTDLMSRNRGCPLCPQERTKSRAPLWSAL